MHVAGEKCNPHTGQSGGACSVGVRVGALHRAGEIHTALRTGASYAALHTGTELRLVGVDFVKTNKKVMVGPKE